MQLPFSWLKSLFSEDLNSQIIADTLTKAGIEVDLVEPYSPPFSGVIVAKVLEVSPHPDAQKLQVAKVFDGHSHYQVVCGAPNCRKDLIVAFAKPFFVAKDHKDAKNELYIVLDNSFSMQAKGQKGELLKRAVQDLLEHTPDGASFSLLPKGSLPNGCLSLP
jgi:hypothetical protein